MSKKVLVRAPVVLIVLLLPFAGCEQERKKPSEVIRFGQTVGEVAGFVDNGDPNDTKPRGDILAPRTGSPGFTASDLPSTADADEPQALIISSMVNAQTVATSAQAALAVVNSFAATPFTVSEATTARLEATIFADGLLLRGSSAFTVFGRISDAQGRAVNNGILNVTFRLAEQQPPVGDTILGRRLDVFRNGTKLRNSIGNGAGDGIGGNNGVTETTGRLTLPAGTYLLDFAVFARAVTRAPSNIELTNRASIRIASVKLSFK